MIAAIDESGIFSLGKSEYSIFVSTVIPTDAKSHLKIGNSYKNWENKLGSRFFNKKKEVKGSLLGDSELGSFVEQVISPFNDIRINCIGFNTSKIDPSILQKHKNIEVAQLEYSVNDFEINHAPKRQTNYIKSIRGWLNSKNLSEYLKILGLRNCISTTLTKSMIYFFGNLRENEIINASYEIDKDFISDQNIYWQGYFKMLLLEYTKNEPLPIINTWDKENHPFFLKYPLLDNKKVNLSPLFKNNLSFKNSESSIYIRISDICAIIIYRNLNHNKNDGLFRFLQTRALTNDGLCELLMLRDFDFKLKFDDFIKNLSKS
jgi:hypothetical protein